MKHAPTTALFGFLWNWGKSSVIDDQIFIMSCINWALKDEIKWPNIQDMQVLASMVPSFPRCIGIVMDVLGQDFEYFKKNLMQTTKESREKSLTQVY